MLTKKQTKKMNLSDVLNKLGYSHGFGDRGQGQLIFRDGHYIGQMSCAQCWLWLRDTGEVE